MSKKRKIIIGSYVLILYTLFIVNRGIFGNIISDLSYMSCGSSTGIPAPIPKITTVGYNLLIIGTPLALIIFFNNNFTKSNCISKC